MNALPERPRPIQHRQGWWQVLLAGLALYAAGLWLLEISHIQNILPTVAILGTFTVPFAFVMFLYEHRLLSRVTTPLLGAAFFFGGAIAVLGATVLEWRLVDGQNLSSFITGSLIEELVKVVAMLLVIRRVISQSEMDGIIVGGATGMGFSALESIGYVFSFWPYGVTGLSMAIDVTLQRGVSALVVHGAWTAVVAGILFRDSRGGHYRLTWSVASAFGAVAGIHFMWNGFSLVVKAMALTLPVVIAVQVVIGALGLALLVWRWQVARQDRLALAEHEDTF